MATGSITNDQVEFVETWENLSPMTNFIIKLDMRGDEKHEEVSGKRQFSLTTQDRLITQQRVLDPKNDPFRNGCFRPVITPDDITIETNPNSLSDEDILRIFKASAVAWDEWLENVDAEPTLRRMVELADLNQDDIPLRRYKQLQTRLETVAGGKRNARQKDEETYASLGGQSTDKEARKNASKRAMTSSSASG